MSAGAQPRIRAFALDGPLPSGLTVLEASAGTGKTYTIAALATRYVAELGLTLDQLLLVTFTRVATSELRERVRERLVFTESELSRILRGAPPSRPDDVVELLAGAPPEQVRLHAQRLAAAVSSFDAATIETTHGFCQRVLDSLGSLGDSDPEATLIENPDELVQEVVDDLYVRRFYRDTQGLPISREQAGAIARVAIDNPTAEVHPLGEAAELPAMRARLARAARSEFEARKRTLGLMTHDDQLTRLLAVLQSDGGQAAAAMLQQRFRVVLIDEFQDTDPVQWEIVKRAFAHGATTLVLIGDPKQAIYAFRGADVYAYLQASGEATQQATLEVNRRSDQALLDALDVLFAQARLGHPQIIYRQVAAAPANREPRLLGAPVREALRVRVLAADDTSVERTSTGFAGAPSARAVIARDLADDVRALLHSGARIELRDQDGSPQDERALAPGDVAVLVRSHHQADLVHAALSERGVAAVIGGSGSVFATPAAPDWETLLQALERPAHPGRARAAALTPFLGWTAQRVALADDGELEELHRSLHVWARTLREHGIAALARQVFSAQQVAARVLAQVDGERRLTDLQHVAELMHAAATAQRLGITALTGWLRERIAAAGHEGANDELTRRLDSDADAVQVLTVHRSKGLEFAVVYCPFLWDSRWAPDRSQPITFHDPQRGESRALDVGLEGAEYQRHLAQHNAEERGEELRLAYVALTRARHQAVIWWVSAWNARDSPLARLLLATDPQGNVAAQVDGRPREAQVLERLAAMRAQAPMRWLWRPSARRPAALGRRGPATRVRPPASCAPRASRARSTRSGAAPPTPPSPPRSTSGWWPPSLRTRGCSTSRSARRRHTRRSWRSPRWRAVRSWGRSCTACSSRCSSTERRSMTSSQICWRAWPGAPRACSDAARRRWRRGWRPRCAPRLAERSGISR